MSLDPPPLFDEDDSRKEDDNDLFASAVQSPISDDVTSEAEHLNSTKSHPLLDEPVEDKAQQALGNPTTNTNPDSEIEESTTSSSHHDLFKSCGEVPMTSSEDLKDVCLESENVEQVRGDFDIEGKTGDAIGGGLSTNTVLDTDSSFGAPKTDPSYQYLKEGPPAFPCNSKPQFLSDTDTTEIQLDDNAQEIPLNDDEDEDDEGSMFKTVEDSSKLVGNQHSNSPPRTANVVPPPGGSLPQSPPAVFTTSYNAATASSISPSPISPIGAPIPIPGAKLNSLEQMEKDGGDNFIEIFISDPQKIGDGMGSYMAYKVTTKTNIAFFRKKHWSVTRRFSDFLGLHSKLVEKHLHSGVIIPPAPEKDAIAATKIKLGSDKNSDSSSIDFIERRRAALERYMNRTAAHPKLRSDPDFREFIELDTDLPKATSTSAISGAGVMRLFNRVGETVNKMTFKMDESDQWFEEKTQQIENLDNQLRKLHLAMEGLVGYRKELANSTGSFSKSAAVLSSVEEHTALSRALHQLSEAMERVHTIHHSQADADFFHLSETTKDYVNIIGAVKEVFHERVKTFQTWQHAQVTLAKKRENKAKTELTGRIDKVDQAHEEVKEWESKVERSQEEFERISKAIKIEMEQFDTMRVIDFKDVLVKYLEALIASQLQIVKVWESFLPEAKAIA